MGLTTTSTVPPGRICLAKLASAQSSSSSWSSLSSAVLRMVRASSRRLPSSFLHSPLFHPGKPPRSAAEDDHDDEDEEDCDVALNTYSGTGKSLLRHFVPVSFLASGPNPPRRRRRPRLFSVERAKLPPVAFSVRLPLPSWQTVTIPNRGRRRSRSCHVFPRNRARPRRRPRFLRRQQNEDDGDHEDDQEAAASPPLQSCSSSSSSSTSSVFGGASEAPSGYFLRSSPLPSWQTVTIPKRGRGRLGTDAKRLLVLGYYQPVPPGQKPGKVGMSG